MPSPNPPLNVKIKNFFNILDLGNVFAVRRWRRTLKIGCTQHSSTIIHHEDEHSVLVDVPNGFPVPLSTLHSNSSLLMHHGSPVISSATSSRGDSSARKASDMAQTVLPFVQGVAGAIPVAGPPIQATISGLLTILQAIDRRTQNKGDFDRLESRLHRLNLYLCNAPTAQDPSEPYRRDSVIRMLQDISAHVTQLYNRGFGYTPITQAIAGCSNEIDRYLADYSVVFSSLKIFSSQMQSQHVIYEMQKTLERQEEFLRSVFLPGQSSVGPMVKLGFVKLVDATDHLHAIPMDVCDSFERFNEQLQLLFKCNSDEARIQRQYMEEGRFDLCIDDDKQVTRLTSHEWPSITAGTTIVMRVIFERRTSSSRDDYHCHFCGAVNNIDIGAILHSLLHQAGCSINW
ncbi:hypothetical protein BD769DRAFT_1667303 [Suillus cothurnatus]|nr:hypothetical protein BD769DRAFT_1667303 [Suillus cothurnatus]